MSSPWSIWASAWGTPDRIKATLDEQAEIRALGAMDAATADAVRLAEARFVEGGSGVGMATPHCAFDDAETAVICQAARLETLEACELVEREFGLGARASLAREAVHRIKTGGTMLMTESAIRAYDPPVRVIESAQ